MKLLIYDKFGNKRIYENVIVIPRIGEYIEWEYSDSPLMVKIVLYDYEKNAVVVKID